MVGDGRTDEVTVYLARLLGHPVSADQPLRLRSVHRAAFVSWARNQKLPVQFALITSGAPFSVRQLLTGEQAPPAATPAAVRPAVAQAGGPGARSASFAGIGIDIEEVQALPHTDDYRDHPFFRDTFTPAELSHCVRQADVRASFCGTWAAKEAVIKSGRVPAPAERLNVIEIMRDEHGRPIVAGCHLSISHTATTAVAVCIALSESSATASTNNSLPAAIAASAPLPPAARADRRVQMKVAAAFAAIIVGGGALSLALHAWP